MCAMEADIQEGCRGRQGLRPERLLQASFDVQLGLPPPSLSRLRTPSTRATDIILVNAVSSTGLDPIIEKAQDAGIIYINADCEYTSPDVNVLNVSTDQYYLGYETAKYAAEVLGEGAKVIMIAALDGNSANTDRQNGFADAIEEYGLEVVGGQYNHDWDAVKAQQIMTEILNSGLEFGRHPDLPVRRGRPGRL